MQFFFFKEENKLLCFHIHANSQGEEKQPIQRSGIDLSVSRTLWFVDRMSSGSNQHPSYHWSERSTLWAATKGICIFV